MEPPKLKFKLCRFRLKCKSPIMPKGGEAFREYYIIDKETNTQLLPDPLTYDKCIKQIKKFCKKHYIEFDEFHENTIKRYLPHNKHLRYKREKPVNEAGTERTLEIISKMIEARKRNAEERRKNKPPKPEFTKKQLENTSAEDLRIYFEKIKWINKDPSIQE